MPDLVFFEEGHKEGDLIARLPGRKIGFAKRAGIRPELGKLYLVRECIPYKTIFYLEIEEVPFIEEKRVVLEKYIWCDSSDLSEICSESKPWNYLKVEVKSHEEWLIRLYEVDEDTTKCFLVKRIRTAEEVLQEVLPSLYAKKKEREEQEKREEQERQREQERAAYAGWTYQQVIQEFRVSYPDMPQHWIAESGGYFPLYPEGLSMEYRSPSGKELNWQPRLSESDHYSFPSQEAVIEAIDLCFSDIVRRVEYQKERDRQSEWQRYISALRVSARDELQRRKMVGACPESIRIADYERIRWGPYCPIFEEGTSLIFSRENEMMMFSHPESGMEGEIKPEIVKKRDVMRFKFLRVHKSRRFGTWSESYQESEDGYRPAGSITTSGYYIHTDYTDLFWIEVPLHEEERNS